jgi:hypothetical protein
MRHRFRTAAFAVVIPTLAFAACDRTPFDPHDDHELLGQVVILDRSTVPHTPIVTWNHDTGWDRDELMSVSHGTDATRTRVSLGAQMFNRGGTPIELGGEYSLRYGVTSDPDNVIDMGVSANLFHGDHVHIYGFHEEARVGVAEIIFALYHVDHSDGETEAIGIRFTE